MPASGGTDIGTGDQGQGDQGQGDLNPGDQGNGRRRARREDGEKAPRSRRPRRSREEAVDEEPVAVEAEEAGNVDRPEPLVAPMAEIQRPMTSAPVAAMPAETSAETIAAKAADPQLDVTIIGESGAGDDAPKRRGWWRRLIE